jgi:hypothetical protein
MAGPLAMRDCRTSRRLTRVISTEDPAGHSVRILRADGTALPAGQTTGGQVRYLRKMTACRGHARTSRPGPPRRASGSSPAPCRRSSGPHRARRGRSLLRRLPGEHEPRLQPSRQPLPAQCHQHTRRPARPGCGGSGRPSHCGVIEPRIHHPKWRPAGRGPGRSGPTAGPGPGSSPGSPGGIRRA